MNTLKPRTNEDRLEEIEHEVHEIKALLLKMSMAKEWVAVKLPDEFMNVKELAKFAKVEASLIYSACAKRELRFSRTGKAYKFKKEDVLEWLNPKPGDNMVKVDEYVEKYLQKHVLKG